MTEEVEVEKVTSRPRNPGNKRYYFFGNGASCRLPEAGKLSLVEAIASTPVLTVLKSRTLLRGHQLTLMPVKAVVFTTALQNLPMRIIVGHPL